MRQSQLRVLFLDAVTDPHFPGVEGLSDITWQLANRLTNLGMEVCIVGSYEESSNQPFPDIEFIKIHPRTTKRQNIFTLLQDRAALAWKAKRFQHKRVVFHVSDTFTAGFLAVMGLGNKTIWQGHSNVLHNSRFGNPWDRTTYYALRLFNTIAARSIRFVVALGPSLISWWHQSGFNLGSIVVIPNGIEVENSQVSSEVRSLPIGWVRKKNKLLYVGRLSKDKGGFIELLICLQILNESDSQTGLLVVGDGPLRADIESFARSTNTSDSVNFLGNQPRGIVNSIYPESDLLILPSINEMMPRVMLEAWLYGSAFMGTNVGAVGDYIVDGHNGYLLSTLTPEYLAQRVTAALNDRKIRRQIIEVGKREVRNYRWSEIARKYKSVYETV